LIPVGIAFSGTFPKTTVLSFTQIFDRDYGGATINPLLAPPLGYVSQHLTWRLEVTAVNGTVLPVDYEMVMNFEINYPTIATYQIAIWNPISQTWVDSKTTCTSQSFSQAGDVLQAHICQSGQYALFSKPASTTGSVTSGRLTTGSVTSASTSGRTSTSTSTSTSSKSSTSASTSPSDIFSMSSLTATFDMIIICLCCWFALMF